MNEFIIVICFEGVDFIMACFLRVKIKDGKLRKFNAHKRLLHHPTTQFIHILIWRCISYTTLEMLLVLLSAKLIKHTWCNYFAFSFMLVSSYTHQTSGWRSHTTNFDYSNCCDLLLFCFTWIQYTVIDNNFIEFFHFNIVACKNDMII